MKKKNFTNKEMLKLPFGTLVKIKDSYDCDLIYKKGGKLVFQTVSQMDDGDRQFGILVEDAVNFSFSCTAYELIDKKTPLNEKERKKLDAILAKHPKWKKAEKEEDARRLIEWFCEDNDGMSYKQLQLSQIRVSKREITIDIFPQSQKYHDINKNIKGAYKDLIEFLCNHFEILRRGI
jgi:hypothetical protein